MTHSGFQDENHCAVAHRGCSLQPTCPTHAPVPASLAGFAPTEAETAGMCALYFQTPIIKTIRSEHEKQADLEADIAAREEPYQLTSQYVTSLTAFLPELINSMVSSRILKHQEKLPFHTAKHLIRNIY